MNGDVELTWTGSGEGVVHTINAKDTGALVWHPEEKSELTGLCKKGTFGKPRKEPGKVRQRKRGMVHMEQSALIMTMLMHFNMQECDVVQSPFLNPMPTKTDVPEGIEEQEAMQKSYDIYGAIGYLNCIQMGTRMDISCTLDASQFAAKLVKHMMRWMKSTINHQITLSGSDDPQIQLFTDTASNPTDMGKVKCKPADLAKVKSKQTGQP
jgi:hypothetical protein